MTNRRVRWMGRGFVGWLLVASLGCAQESAPASQSAPVASSIATGTTPTSPSYESRDGRKAKDDTQAPARRPASAPFTGTTDRAERGAGEAEGPGGPIGDQKGYGSQGGAPVAPPLPVGANGPIDMGVIAPQASIAIDPNGRFATTYRPGAGHLAAFDSAVARGIVPAGEREVVSDIGARYAPSMTAPTGKALSMQTDFERDKLAPSGGPVHMRLALRSTAQKPVERPHLSVHLVLDVSGSMAGESIQRAREAAAALVDKLAPTDDFSLVTFSSDAEVKVTDGPVGPRREQIKTVIAAIHENGGTNISSGLQLGYQQAMTKTIPDDAVKVVLLLSDGRPNAGLIGTEKLSKLSIDAFQNGIQTSSFGIGTDYDGALMSSIASDGAGGYYYLRDAAQIAPALSTEIDRRLDPAATAVEVRVRWKKDIQLLDVYGSRRLNDAEATRVRTQEIAADQQAQKRDHIKADRDEDAEGGTRFFIPAFAGDDSHTLLFKLNVPAGVGTRGIASVELKYKDRTTRKNVVDEVPITLTFADSDAASAATISPSVSRSVQGFAAGKTLSEASVLVAQGNKAGATVMLSERESLLRAAATSLNEPLLNRDADRLARLRGFAGTTTGMGDPLVLAMLLETAGNSHMR